MKKPIILVTNDDGVTSRGIRLLVNIAKEFGHVVVVAPDSPQSGMGHAITIGNTLRLDRTDIFSGIEAYECSGTPADCVKLAKHHVLRDTAPDLVLSGVNHGSNNSISVIYSGTMSAAIEAAIEGIPAIGFSLCDYNHQAPMGHIAEWMRIVISNVLKHGITKGVALNVNFPAWSNEPIKGLKVCRQANAKWQEMFERRKDPYGRPYFWMAGDFVNKDQGGGDDVSEIANNYATIVPCKYDLTDYEELNKLKNWDL